MVVGNPIDPASVVPDHRLAREHERLVVGYLGFESPVKGFVLLPEIARRLRADLVELVCVTREWPTEQNSPEVNDALAQLRELSEVVTFRPRDHDVRALFAEIDVLLVPSLSESFCRIAAEAMVNGMPVVASDLPALHEVCGPDAALFFPVGDTARAAESVNELATDAELRDTARRPREGSGRGVRSCSDRREVPGPLLVVDPREGRLLAGPRT